MRVSISHHHRQAFALKIVGDFIDLGGRPGILIAWIGCRQNRGIERIGDTGFKPGIDQRQIEDGR